MARRSTKQPKIPARKLGDPAATRFSNEAMTEIYVPTKGSNDNTGKPRRYWNWAKGYVVENVGYTNSYFRKMSPAEMTPESVHDIDTGEIYADVISYSEVCSDLVLLKTDAFGLSYIDPQTGNVARETITARCEVTIRA